MQVKNLSDLVKYQENAVVSSEVINKQTLQYQESFLL